MLKSSPRKIKSDKLSMKFSEKKNSFSVTLTYKIKSQRRGKLRHPRIK